MTTKDYIRLRKQLYAEMMGVKELCDKSDSSIGCSVDAFAALRHLYDVTTREEMDLDRRERIRHLETAINRALAFIDQSEPQTKDNENRRECLIAILNRGLAEGDDS